MGHSDISLTANIYTHSTNATLLQAAEKMEKGTTPKGTTLGTTSEQYKTV